MGKTQIVQPCKQKGWTQERLAEESGVAVPTIQRVESGTDASMETLALIAVALGASAEERFPLGGDAPTEWVVEALNNRLRAEQELQWKRRRAIESNWKYWYPAIGVIVAAIFVTIVESGAGTGSLMVVPVAWWAVGYFIMQFFKASRLEQGFDKRFPSLPNRASKYDRRLQYGISTEGRYGCKRQSTIGA